MVTFYDDEKAAFKHLAAILEKMNLLQDPALYSFPLATFLSHVSGNLYTHIMNKQNDYNTFMVVSGTGNTSRTGKSLMNSMWQMTFDGHKSSNRMMTWGDVGIPQLDDRWITWRAGFSGPPKMMT